jgi:translation initiation factor IF-2
LAKNSKLHVKNTQLAGAINLRGLKAKLSRKKDEPAEKTKKPRKRTKSVLAEAKTKSTTKTTTTKAKKTSVKKQKTTSKATVAPIEEKVVVAQVEPEIAIAEAPQEKPAKSVEKEGGRPKAKAKKLAKEVVPETVVKKATKDLKKKPVFLSAIKGNAEGLGPVLDKKLSVPKKEKTVQKEKAVQDEERLKRASEAKAKKEATPKSEEREALGWSWQDKKGAPKRGDSAFDSKGRKKSRLVGKRDFSDAEDEERRAWRKKRSSKGRLQREIQQEISRPTNITVRIPISVKDLASEMKLKASQLISTLFMQGSVVTLNDLLDDETLVQLLGHELGCEIAIDTSEEERIQITSESITQEIKAEKVEDLVIRPPVVTFMGHVDHGKTSIIDVIRRSKIVEAEAGAITQHIGAFTCKTEHGQITIIDTPGHEAFSAMRERGAGVTDIVVLVIAGDEGMQEQTYEALKQAQEANATIIVAVNKSDKPSFDQDKVYRQLADCQLLPESWGGQTITVPCSALTEQGIKELLEMISIQAEVMELRANPKNRARGTVIESEMVKGLGPMATVLVQNGMLRIGDSLVFGVTYARVKLMRDEAGRELMEAGPSIPVRISGLSGLPSSGEEFIVVGSEKEARDIAEKRQEGQRQLSFQIKRRRSVESMMEKSGSQEKKVLPLIIRADVQGSLDAVKTALLKIKSDKVEISVISMDVGEVSESDVQLAAASKATILGFHSCIEGHDELMVKGMGVKVCMHDIIYHAQDDIKERMRDLLDKIAEEQERGQAEVKAIFKSSQLGIIAGCMVTDGMISRNSSIRVRRDGELLWSGAILSLKRFKDDVKEVSKGVECGIVLQGFSDFQEGDQLEAFDVTYREQEL